MTKRAKMIKLRAEGMETADIARQLGIPYRNVWDYLKKMGKLEPKTVKECKPKKPKPLTKAQRILLSWDEGGKSVAQVSREVEADYMYTWIVLRKNDCTKSP